MRSGNLTSFARIFVMTLKRSLAAGYQLKIEASYLLVGKI